MNLSEFEKLLYSIAMDSVFMSRPENSMMINSMITELQNIQNAGNVLRGDMTNDSYKMAMSNKLAEFENVFIMSASQRLTEHGIPVMNSYNPPQMQQSMQNPYGQPMQNPYGQPMQNPYGQPMQNPYGQPMQNPYGQPKPQMPSYMQQPPMQQMQQPQMMPQPQQMQPQPHQQMQPQPQPQPQQMQPAPAPRMPEPEPAPAPAPSKPLPPISYDAEMPRASKKSHEEKSSGSSSGVGVFGMGGEALPGAKKGNEPPGSAAGRDFLLSLLEKQ